MKTANLAIVFTDIQGFTQRTSAQTLEENQRLLATHAELLTPIFRGFGGKVVKSIGDAFLVTFASPTQAVLSGVAIQDRLWAHNRSAPEAERLNVRVAINVGEVRLEGNDIFGEPVNIASRVEGIAPAGEVYFTEAVYLAMNKAEVPSQPVGEFDLKGIPGQVKVFRVPFAHYRMEAQLPEGPASKDEPPFGNLGLARLEEARSGTGEWAVTAKALGERAVARSGLLVDRLSSATSALSARAKGLPRRGLFAGIGAVVLVCVLGFLVLGPSKLDRALDAVTNAPDDQRSAKADAVRELISHMDDRGEAELARGRLNEALGAPEDAVDHYVRAVKEGDDDGSDRLVHLLGSDSCRARAHAAESLGELDVTSAEDALKRLAATGGPGDNGIPIFGCNSKDAAQSALKRMNLD